MAQLYWYRDGNSNLNFKGDYGQIIKGVFNATLPVSGLPLSPSRTWFERGNVDDGGAVLAGTGAAYLYGTRRMLLTAAQTGNNSFMGGCDRLSVAASQAAVTGVMSAHWGMLELKSGGITPTNVAGCGAVRADLNCQSGSTVSSGSIVSAFLAACEALSSTHSGRYTVVHVPNPQAGTFDSFAEFGSATGCTGVNGSGSGGVTSSSTGTLAMTGQIKIYVNGNAVYIPYGTVS